MTFTEAALEVLRSAGEPLHYKRITELAIAGNLLSHVGKTPEVTMSSRLATLVKKDRGQSPIIKVRPGVFALRDSSMHTDKESSPNGAAKGGQSLIPNAEAEAPETVAAERPERPSLPGADVFPEEADDDAPILAGIDEPGGDDRNRRRRRRRRRGKGGADLPGEAPAGASAGGGERERSERRDPPTVRLDRDATRIDREAARRDRDAGRRDRESAGRRDQSRRDAPRPERFDRDTRARDESVDIDLSRSPAEGDLLGKDLADAAYHVLCRGERLAVNFTRVAELLVRRGRLNGTPSALAPTVAAALRADAARASRSRARPRFRLSGPRVSLSEWSLPKEAARSQEAVEQSAEQQRDQVRRAFVSRLNDLPAAGFAELIATWLNAEGVTALRAVKRPGSSSREFHFAGTLRRGVEEQRLALVVLRSGRDIDRDLVVDVRGSMHHYGGAHSAWLISTGRVQPAAKEEVSAEGAVAPVALFGGADLARAMEASGIGLRLHYIPLCDIDFDLLESLGDRSALAAPAREERPGRDRDRERERQPEAQVVSADRRSHEPISDADQDGAEDEDEQEHEPRASLVDVTAAASGLDLLDTEAAEASRLIGASWQPDAEDFEEDADADAALEAAEAEAEDLARDESGIDLEAEELDEDEAAEDELASADDESVEEDASAEHARRERSQAHERDPDDDQ